MGLEHLLRQPSHGAGAPVSVERRQLTLEQLCGTLLIRLHQKNETPGAGEILDPQISTLVGRLAGIRDPRQLTRLQEYFIGRMDQDKKSPNPQGLAKKAASLISESSEGRIRFETEHDSGIISP